MTQMDTGDTALGLSLVGYIRVSSEGQAKDGWGLDVQERDLREWCAAHGHQVATLHHDDITGTKDEAGRPGLAAALAEVEDGAAGIVIPSLHRLARHLTVQEAVLAQVWKHGGRVFAVDTGEVLRDDPDDPMRTFIRQVMGAVAQLERGMIVARLRKGRRMKHEQGGYAFGAPGFGFKAVERELALDEDEQHTITRILQLRRAGGSLRAIAETLEQEGRRPKRAERWHIESVRRILKRIDVPETTAA